MWQTDPCVVERRGNEAEAWNRGVVVVDENALNDGAAVGLCNGVVKNPCCSVGVRNGRGWARNGLNCAISPIYNYVRNGRNESDGMNGCWVLSSR